MKRLYRSIHIGLIENFEQKTTGFNCYCLVRKDCSKDNMAQSTESFKKVFNKKECSSTHTFFLKNFDQKTTLFNLHCLFRNFDEKTKRFNP